MTLSLGSFHQDAASSVTYNIDAEEWTKKNALCIENNMNLIGDSIIKSGLFTLKGGIPKGGFFSFPEISELYQRIPLKYKSFPTKGGAVIEFLLEKCKIAVVPGHIYGTNGSDYIRIVTSVEE